jgi:hypothetical protein
MPFFPDEPTHVSISSTSPLQHTQQCKKSKVVIRRGNRGSMDSSSIIVTCTIWGSVRLGLASLIRPR